jgi:hypothetical protein
MILRKNAMRLVVSRWNQYIYFLVEWIYLKLVPNVLALRWIITAGVRTVILLVRPHLSPGRIH